MNKTKFKLGPIQEEWLRRLEAHPEKQLTGQLGRDIGTPNERCCCLGEGLLTIHAMRGTAPELDVNKKLLDIDDGEILSTSCTDLGLRSDDGSLARPIERNGRKYTYLAGMNDKGFTWPEIAAEIRKDPENFFVESV